MEYWIVPTIPVTEMFILFINVVDVTVSGCLESTINAVKEPINWKLPAGKLIGGMASTYNTKHGSVVEFSYNSVFQTVYVRLTHRLRLKRKTFLVDWIMFTRCYLIDIVL